MTPRQIVALCELLDDLVDWLEEHDPGCLDADIVARAGEVALEVGAQLVKEGAQ